MIAKTAIKMRQSEPITGSIYLGQTLVVDVSNLTGNFRKKLVASLGDYRVELTGIVVSKLGKTAPSEQLEIYI
jgi:hypothetical protein